jgi:4'-phosphopantetheinyl transferase
MWQNPPDNLVLTPDDVHLWQMDLDLPVSKVQELENILSTDEKTRAERFYFQQHKNRFIVGRATLRIILGRYLDRSPQQIQFEYSSRGKPSLAKCGSQGLKFNLSHSQNLALYGFACDRAIGVDLEYIRAVTDVQQIARRFFSPSESATIMSLSEEEKFTAFFRGWTAKEAYLKATGDGLSGSLDKIEVSLLPNEPVRLLSIDGNPQIAARWRLSSFAPAVDYLATIAVEGHDWRLSCWQGIS